MAGQEKIIVSLTAISTRLHVLDRVIGSLLNQSRKPDRIILNLSLSPHLLDQGVKFEDLPLAVRRAAVAGDIELYFCKNTGPYRKIIPTLERFGDADYFVATADDDVLYPPEWLQVLLDTALTHRCISAYRCRVMQREGDGFAPYGHWPLLREGQSGPALDVLPTGRDGVLYHARHFKDRAALRELMRLAPMQDDIALRFTAMLAGVPVAVAPRSQTSMPGGLEFPAASLKDSLWVLNRNGQNDEAINNCANWLRAHRAVKVTV